MIIVRVFKGKATSEKKSLLHINCICEYQNSFKLKEDNYWVKNRSFVTMKYAAQVFLNLYPETMFKDLKRYRPYIPHQNVGNPRYCTPCPGGRGGGEVHPISQKLIISKYSHATPHFKGNFMLNHNQVIKGFKSQVQVKKIRVFFYNFYCFKP